MINPQIIYQETNPYESFTAYIEDDGRTVYFYLQAEQNKEMPIKSVWICNQIETPYSRSEQDFENGLAPMLIKDEITENHQQISFESEKIELVWGEEGDSVAFFYQNELYAFIPSWSGQKGFHGYSKFAKIEALTAHPLLNPNYGQIPEKIKTYKKFWQNRFKNHNWKLVQESRLDFLEKNLGKHIYYWSADGKKFPPLGIALFHSKKYPKLAIYSTIGMSAQNMPQVELYHKDISNYAKIELVFAVDISEEDRTRSWVPHLIGDIINYPWRLVHWFGHGHTILMTRSDPSALYIKFESIIFKSLNQIKEFKGLRSEDNFQVQFLSILPISSTEKAFCMENNSDKFFSLLSENNIEWFHKSDRKELY